MKKSEMTQKMAEYWFGLFPDEDPKNMGVDHPIFHLVKKRMGDLISFLEEEGMKAPIKKKCPVLLTETYEWEPEDEQKK